jgi:hypothetical protein
MLSIKKLNYHILRPILAFSIYYTMSLSNTAHSFKFNLNTIQQETISVGLIQTGSFSEVESRLSNLGFEVTLLAPSSGLNEFNNYDIIYLPYEWASAFNGSKSEIEANAPDYKDYIQNGGSIIMDYPNSWNFSPQLLPYAITINELYSRDDNEWPPIVVDPNHVITSGLPEYEMPGPRNQITSLAAEYEILVKSRITDSPTLVIATYGNGKILVHTADPSYFSKHPIGDKVYRRMIRWLAGLEIDDRSEGPAFFQEINITGKTLSIDIKDNFLFVGKRDSLIIFDIRDPQNITQVTSLNLFNSLRFLRCYGSQFLLTADSTHIGLLDIEDIENPIYRSKIMLANGWPHTPESKDIYNETAFIHAWQPPFTSINRIFCVSLANPDALTIISKIETGYNSSFPNKKSGVYVSRDNLFVAADDAFDNNFEIFNIGNLINPIKVSGLNLEELIPGYYQHDMNDLAVRDNVAFVIGEGAMQNLNTTGILAAIDISDISQPNLISYVLISDCGIDMQLCGHYLVIVSKSEYYENYSLEIVDVTSPENMIIKDFFIITDYPREVVMKDSLLFIATENTGVVILKSNMQDEFPPEIDRGIITVNPVDAQGNAKVIGKKSSIVDWTPPVAINVVNTATTQEISKVIESDGSFNVNITASNGDAITLSANDSHIPKNVSSAISLPKVSIANLAPFTNFEIQGVAKDIEVSGKICCLALGTDGLAFVDISNPDTPELASQMPLNGDVEDIKIKGRYVFTACNTGGVQVVTFEDVSSPSVIAKHSVSGNAKGIEIQDNYIYVTVSNIGSTHLYEKLCSYEFDGQFLFKLDSMTYYDAYIFGTPPEPYEIAICLKSSYAYICDQAADFVIVDITNPNDLKKLKEIDLNVYGGKSRIHVQGEKA